MSWALSGIATTLVVVAVVLTPLPAARAAGGRPAFQVPFPCGQGWEATTRAGHPAVDWNWGTGSADAGKPVVAAAAGTAVVKSRHDWGYYVDIRHGGGWVTRYAHLLKGGRVEGPVAQGERIGYVGSSGRSTSAHLHWEQIRDGVRQTTLYADGVAIRADGRRYTSRNCRQRSIHTGDVDGDGIDDVVARFVKSDGSSVVRVVRGARSRVLTATVALRVSRTTLPPSAWLAVGDTNGDGRADLNIAHAKNGGVQVTSFYGRSTGAFTAARGRFHSSRWNFWQLKALVAGDVTGDGTDDLAARFVRRDGSSVIRVVRGNRTRALRARVALRTSASALPSPALVTLGDTDGNGHADLAAAVPYGRGTRIVTFAGRSDTTFGARRSRLKASRWMFRRVKALHAGDVNGDGRDDLGLRLVRADGSSVIRTMRGTAGGGLRRAGTKGLTAGALPAAAMTALGDTNGDGRADLDAAFARRGGVQVASFYGQGDTTLGDRRLRYFNRRWPFHRLC